MVHKTNNDFVHVVVRTIGSFSSRFSMYLFGTYCEGKHLQPFQQSSILNESFLL